MTEDALWAVRKGKLCDDTEGLRCIHGASTMHLYSDEMPNQFLGNLAMLSAGDRC